MKKNKKSHNKNNHINNKKDFEVKNDNEKDVWKKILLFMIILFPYALYLFLFKTKVSKYIKAFVILLVSILLIIVADTIRYPDRVHDEIIFSNIKEFKLENKIDDIGTVYDVEKRTVFKYEDNEYMVYNLYDEYSMYYGIFKVEEYNKKYTLVYLYRLNNESNLVYSNDTFSRFDKIHPIIFVHILTDTNFSTFKIIDNVSDINKKDIFENDKYQTIKIDDNKINFKFNDYGVIEYTSKSNALEYSAEVNPLMNTKFKSVYKVLRRNFQDDYKIVGFTYYDIMPVFNILVGDSKYIVQYYYKEGASLRSIDNEEEYFEHLEERYEINSLNKQKQ